MKLTVYENSYKVEPSEKPTFEKDEVLLKVKSSGVCGSDVPRIFNKSSYHYPIVLGHEFSGVIEDAHDKSLIGKRVCVFPLIPCRKCEFCKKQQYANCVKYNYYGSRRDGGTQSYLAVKKSNLIYLPDSVSYDAGAMVEPLAVCLHAVKKLNVKNNDTVAIFGAGAIGLLCGIWAKYFGASNVYFIDIDEQKLAFAETLGFERYNGKTVDYAIECSGAESCINSAINVVKAFSKVALVGNVHGDITLKQSTYSQLLRKQLTLVGNWNSDFNTINNDWVDAINAMANKGINPESIITHKVDLKEGEKAYNVIKNREFYVKIMVGDYE